PSAASRAPTTILPSGAGATRRHARERLPRWQRPSPVSSKLRPTGSSTTVPVLLSINDLETTAPVGVTLFESAEALGIRVPAACLRNGKCKECVVDVDAGADLLSPPAPAERHLAAPFRLSCQAQV